MKYLRFIPHIFIIAYMLGCSSGKQAFEKGNYYQSSIKAIERLRKNPSHKKSRNVLANSYPEALKYYSDQVYQIRRTNNRFKNEQIVDQYNVLNNLYNQIQRCPACKEVIPGPQNFSDEVRTYSQHAARARYEAGKEALETGDRRLAREAYEHFDIAGSYIRGYKDIETLMDRALEIATLKVVIEQVPVPTANYKLSVEFFQDQLDEYLFNYRDNRFVRFYSPSDRSLKQPDQVMVIQFDDFMVGQTRYYESTREVKRDSVEIGEVKLDDGTKKKVFGTVKADYTEYRQEVKSTGLMSVRILEYGTDQVALSEKFPGEFLWVNRWASFNGDERALIKEQLRATKSKRRAPPPHQDMFIEFCKPIYDQFRGTIGSYYRSF